MHSEIDRHAVQHSPIHSENGVAMVELTDRVADTPMAGTSSQVDDQPAGRLTCLPTSHIISSPRVLDGPLFSEDDIEMIMSPLMQASSFSPDPKKQPSSKEQFLEQEVAALREDVQQLKSDIQQLKSDIRELLAVLSATHSGNSTATFDSLENSNRNNIR